LKEAAEMKVFRWIVSTEIFLIAMIVGIATATVLDFAMSVIDSAQLVPDEAVVSPMETPIPVPEEEPPVVVPANAEPSITDDVDDLDSFDPTGNYSIQWNAPKAFSDFVYFKIETRLYHDKNGNYIEHLIPPKGIVHTAKDLVMTRIAVSGPEIAFQTATVGGINYKFIGRFEEGDYCELTGSTSALKGKLTKIKNGKWAAEMEAQFYRDCSCE